MRKLCKPLSVLCAVLILLPGCDWLSQHKEAVTGAAIGAVAGGLLGGAVSGHHHRGRGVVIGAVLGALAGGAIGEYMSQRDRTAPQTAQAMNYQPAQGVVLRMDNARVDPTTVTGGGQVTLSATYSVMSPDMNQQLAVHESRIVTDPTGNKVAEIPTDVSRTPGQYTSQVPIILPAGAPAGVYQVLTSVAISGGAPDQRNTSFTVQGAAPPPVMPLTP